MKIEERKMKASNKFADILATVFIRKDENNMPEAKSPQTL